MSLISRLLQTVTTWLRSRVAPKTTRRFRVALEHLDHRQLLSVNFTGNVPTDFPANLSPGVVVIPDNPSVQHPQIAPSIKPIVKVSGFDINGIRVSYDSTDDSLSIGLQQPDSQQPGRPGSVIASDADNNGNAGTVDPAVAAAEPGFQEFFGLQGPQQMGAFLDLTGSGKADIVAGFPPFAADSPKLYHVSQAIVNSAGGIPLFGTSLPNNTGNVYLMNSPLHPNLEFSIAHFSQLYQAETGKALTNDSVIGIGAFGASQTDIGISDAFFPEQTFTFGNSILPVHECPPPPPAEPPILINPHEHRHINTAHPTDIRVQVLGQARFDVTKIIPQSVTLGGAHPIFSFTRHINRDQYLDETFVFRGTDVTLPPGITDAHVTGTLTDGTTFDSVFEVFNRDKSFYSPEQIAIQQQRQERLGPIAFETPAQRRFSQGALVDAALAQESTAPSTDASSSLGGPVVSVQRRKGVNVNSYATPPVVTIPVDNSGTTVTNSASGPVVSIPTREANVAHRNAPLRVVVPTRARGQATLSA
jgi:hypothetical protein